MKQTHNSVFLSFLLLTISLHLPSQANASRSSNITDRQALLEFKQAVTYDPDGALTSWNSSLHFCNWAGVTCSPKQRVTSLILQGYNLQGTLSPHLGNLSFVRSIQLMYNSFRGGIPPQFGNLRRLRTLNLTYNPLGGAIPTNLTRCSLLRDLRIAAAGLVGKIPDEIGLLSNLEVIKIGTNDLTGPIPDSIGNLSRLQIFSVAYNHLEGQIPDTVARLSSISQFVVGVNRLNGTIPLSLYNLSSMTILTLVYNQFGGRIPHDIGFTLPNLVFYGNSLNWMFGPIPSSFCNASKLRDMNMNRNSLSGRVPDCLGSLPNLVYFNAAANNLGTNSSGDLEFITGLSNCSMLQELGVGMNNLGGSLPDSVANLSARLDQFDVSMNLIREEIPRGMENLIGLNKFDLSENSFTGRIPSYFGGFQNLQGLWMQGNQLSGEIPSSLGNLSQLNRLDISDNRLEGVVPLSLGSCRQLNLLDVSANKLTGNLPVEIFRLSSLSIGLNLSRNEFIGSIPNEIGNLTNVEVLDLSHNFLTGEIPETIGNFKSLKTLYLQQNSLSGSVPQALASLKAMERLDLSLNNFSGGIPPGLQDVQTMKYLNLSFNNLRGEVPTKGIFANVSGTFLMGNPMLCNGVSELHFPYCPTKARSRQKRAATVKLIMIIVLVSTFSFISILGLLLHYKSRRSKKKACDEDSALSHFVRISYKDLCKATNGFSAENLIGSGGFGTIYKGVLEQIETPVAIKVLKIQDKRAHKSLLAECNALKNIRHRNLVRILTYCSSLDRQGNDFKALIFELMPNGSLEEWLHSDRNLSLTRRLNIAVDVASGLHYLHDLCENTIVHCDLKPSNVLLDVDMVARVGDFGLAKILSTGTAGSSSQRKSSTIGIKGTIGYAPPEYGMGVALSEDGDVYSYGILLLEMFTGRRPTNEMFKEGVNICDFVKAALPDAILSILDPSMFVPLLGPRNRGVVGRNAMEVGTHGLEIEGMTLTESARDCLVSVLEIAVSCSTELPRERMKMADVVRKLTSIRDVFVASTSIRRQPNPERG
ncbi:unnamed protein product [Linum trigynum]|uniref:non-specific serine/threonine protein kinase n=1 Tax=Linum trigynum TaxID=586398 RepID=A0AAV2DJW1_9ROSI